MLSFAVIVALIAATSASTPLLTQSHGGLPIAQSTVQRFGKGFSYTTMTGHPSVGAGVYPASNYPYSTYPYNYNTYPYTANYPYAYNTAAGVVQSVPAVSTIGVKPVASNIHLNTAMPVGQTFVQPSTMTGQIPYYYSGYPATTFNNYPHHQFGQFGQMVNQHPWTGAQVAVAH